MTATGQAASKSIGGVEYDDEGFDLQRGLVALAREHPEREAEIAAETATVHEFYRQFRGMKMTTPPAPVTASQRPGRFHGHDATATERASGEAVEAEDLGPLKPGSAAHSVLVVYGDRRRRTSYQASLEACDDFHARRRESTRLLTRGFLMKSGTLANPAPGGREHVDAYEITVEGLAELGRLAA